MSWISETVVLINGNYIDALTGGVQLPPRRHEDDDHKFYSPDKKYFLDCGRDKLRLYQDEQLLGEATFGAFCWDVGWRDDSQAFSVVVNDGLYVWWVSKPKPTKISDKLTGPASWSPDGQRLAYAFCDFPAEKAYADILSVNDWQRLSHIEVSGCGATWEAILYWFNNDILVEPLRYGTDLTAYEYYDAMSGKILGYYVDSIDFPSQKPVLSPDGRWHILEQTNGVMGTNYIYTVYDLQSKDGYILSHSPTHYVAFMAWAEDSSAFYLVHSPANETAKTGADFPFGLLALNPQTRKFQQLFEQAVFAKFSPDKKLAWVVFPAKHADGALGLDGGIFNLANGTLAGRQFVSDRVLYANPAEGDLVPAAWSNDGTRVVFGDSQGSLTLVRTDGTTQSLATNLPHDGWPGNAHYAWSPDDRRLLVQSGNRAWIVTVP
jgi:Tol biopolymer transport system component